MNSFLDSDLPSPSSPFFIGKCIPAREITPANGFPYFTGQENYDTEAPRAHAMISMTIESDFRHCGYDYQAIKKIAEVHQLNILWATLLSNPDCGPNVYCRSVFCTTKLNLEESLPFPCVESFTGRMLVVYLTPEQYTSKMRLTAWSHAISLYRKDRHAFARECMAIYYKLAMK